MAQDNYNYTTSHLHILSTATIFRSAIISQMIAILHLHVGLNWLYLQQMQPLPKGYMTIWIVGVPIWSIWNIQGIQNMHSISIDSSRQLDSSENNVYSLES